MVWRTAHGNARKGGKSQVWENAPDGARPVPVGSADPVERRPDGTVTREGAVALGKRSAAVRAQPDFSDGSAPWLPPCDELAPFDSARRELLKVKRDELAGITGGVSSGTGAILRGWAYIHAAGEFWASRFFATGDPAAFEQMTRAFKAASAEEAKARDAAAWEAAARKPTGHDVIAELQREAAAWEAQRQRDARALPATAKDTSATTPTSDGNVGAANDKVAGPGNGGQL